MTAVADAAGVAAGSVYQHFPSKAALPVEVFRHAAARDVELPGQVLHCPGSPESPQTYPLGGPPASAPAPDGALHPALAGGAPYDPGAPRPRAQSRGDWWEAEGVSSRNTRPPPKGSCNG
ncbi:hypothetical protein SCOCK_10080 [Actinacidiphila cocklensis]|uniref:HTH tetR-type domain-containing protein n=1 Tax=Actinacidiphila cocklensis TaxID=887465 RepID=A0A9W4GNJ5_9ACTN|nr:hypothetical protein SCOCK_10080 [Actinacidiphila cocklensis]